MTYVLLVILSIMLLVSYITSHKELCGPTVVFILPFWIMSIIGCLNYTNWELNDFHFNTVLVISLGIVSFLLGSLFVQKIKLRGNKSNSYEIPDINSNITRFHLVLSLLIGIVSFLLHAYFLLRWGLSQGVFSLSEAINISMIRGKFGTGRGFDLPYIVNSLCICSKAFGYIYSAILAKNIVYKRKGNNILLALNIIVPIGITVLGGSRGSSLEFIVAFSVAVLFYFFKSNGWKNRIRIKHVSYILIVSIFVLYVFFAIKTIMGRGEVDFTNIYDEFCIYIGAQEKNLDLYLNNNPVHTNIFACATMQEFYNIFNNYLGFNIYDTIEILPFNFINGKDLGNVYTCFYNYFVDFGYLGVVIFSSVSGGISQYVYRKAKYASDKAIDFSLIIYSYIASTLFFCFFGSRFFSNVFSAGFIRLVIWVYFDILFLTKVWIFKEENRSLKR